MQIQRLIIVGLVAAVAILAAQHLEGQSVQTPAQQRDNNTERITALESAVASVRRSVGTHTHGFDLVGFRVAHGMADHAHEHDADHEHITSPPWSTSGNGSANIEIGDLPPGHYTITTTVDATAQASQGVRVSAPYIRIHHGDGKDGADRTTGLSHYWTKIGTDGPTTFTRTIRLHHEPPALWETTTEVRSHSAHELWLEVRTGDEVSWSVTIAVTDQSAAE